MEKVTRIAGIAVPLPIDDIDTDALAPTALVTRADVDYGRALLGLRRYADPQGTREQADFILNREPFRRARILVAGANFGCGSSREHAVWALVGFGIRSVVAVGFSDIFYENAFKNGLLAVSLPRATVDAICCELQGHPEMEVDLESCTVVTPAGTVVPFQIDPARRTALLEGLDEIGLTLKDIGAVDAFQARDRATRPWIYDLDLHASFVPGADAIR